MIPEEVKEEFKKERERRKKEKSIKLKSVSEIFNTCQEHYSS
jgi:hypothetical protein